MEQILLDLGAGKVSPPDYRPMGHEHGTEIYPLPYADNTVTCIRASHVLEHFSMAGVHDVLAEWVRVLKPGGVLRIAVPDFGKIAEGYVSGQYQPTAGWVMGGQTAENDFHRSIFDGRQLRVALSKAGLVLLRPWKSEIDDCAGFDVSLNFEGTKPFLPEIKVSAALSVPRLGFMACFGCAIDALMPLKIKLRRQGGAFWGQALENCLERILEEDDPDFILTLDYDSIFTIEHVATMMQLLLVHPEIDALAPIQSNRHQPTALLTIKGADGVPLDRIDPALLEQDVMPAATAHFGLTFIRAKALKALPKPWFHSIPDAGGGWHDGHVDDDSRFWFIWEKAGYNLHIANRIAIGHLEEVARFPDQSMQAGYQTIADFNNLGPPEWAWK